MINIRIKRKTFDGLYLMIKLKFKPVNSIQGSTQIENQKSLINIRNSK